MYTQKKQTYQSQATNPQSYHYLDMKHKQTNIVHIDILRYQHD